MSADYIFISFGIIEIHSGNFDNRMPLKPALEGGCVCGGGGGGGEGGGRAYAASQTTMLHMKRLDKTESPIFVL